MDYLSRIADDLGNDGPTVLFGSLCLIGFDSSIVVSLQSSSCLTPGPVSPGLFLPRSRPWLLSTAAERWFEVRSCKPTSRGRPSSVKQLRTLRSCKLRVLMAHCHRLPVNYYLMNIEARFYGVQGTSRAGKQSRNASNVRPARFENRVLSDDIPNELRPSLDRGARSGLFAAIAAACVVTSTHSARPPA